MDLPLPLTSLSSLGCDGQVWARLASLPITSVVVWPRIETGSSHGHSTGGDHLGNPFHGLATCEMTLALWTPQPERWLLGGEDVAVFGVIGVLDTRHGLAAVPPDLFNQPDLGRRRAVLCLQIGQAPSLLCLLGLGFDPTRIPGHGLGRPPLARVPSQATQHVGHDPHLELGRP